MDKYLIDDYNRKKSGQTEAAKKKRLKALELYLHGLDKKEIAEILEVDVSTVNIYFQWLRSNGYITLEQEQEIETSRALELERIKEKSSGGGPLTINKVKKISNERDRQILKLHNEGFTLEKISEKLNLTLDQARERFLALGLSIYSEQELEQMREEESRKLQEAEEEKRKREAELQENKGDGEEVEDEPKETEDKTEEERGKPEAEGVEGSFEKIVNTITNYDDLVKKANTFIKLRKSRKAVNLFEYFINYGDFLTDKQRKKLKDIVAFIEVMRPNTKKSKGEHDEER